MGEWWAGGPNANDVFLSSLTFGRLVKELLSVCSGLKACVHRNGWGLHGFTSTFFPFFFTKWTTVTGQLKWTRLIVIKVAAGKGL